MLEMKQITLMSLFLAFIASSAAAQTAENLYKGKTIRMIVGTSAGGGFDTYTRTLARHFGRHVPGQPSIIVENMPGAGHLIAANHMYNIVKPDGLTSAISTAAGFFINCLRIPASSSMRPNSNSSARRSKRAAPAR